MRLARNAVTRLVGPNLKVRPSKLRTSSNEVRGIFRAAYVRLLRDVEVITWFLAQAKEDQHATAQKAGSLLKGLFVPVVGHFGSFRSASYVFKSVRSTSVRASLSRWQVV